MRLPLGSRRDRETDGMPQAVEVVDDALAEPIELMPLGTSTESPAS